MSYNSPFFDFFDAINNEVDYFNRFLYDRSNVNTKRQRLTAPDDGSKSKQVTQRDPNASYELGYPRDRFVSDLDDWFDNDFALLPRGKATVGVPVDILDHDKNYELHVTVPGVKSKKDINLEYHKNNNQIVITGEIPDVITEENKDKVKVQERVVGKFKRVVSLPEYPGIDPDNIKADYSNGILTLTVPKLKPAEDGKDHVKKIEISSQESWGDE